MKINSPPKNKTKILIYDLEVSPLNVWTYSRWDSNAIWVEQEQFLMSFAYKWYGSSKTHYLDLRGSSSYKRDKRDDRELTQALFNLWQQSDLLLAYNGDRFDQKIARTFFMRHGLIPNNIKSIDPLKIAKKEFKLSSNAMKQVAVELGVAPKLDVPLGHLTQLIIEQDDKKAWKEFKRYNIQDVDTLEAIWDKIKPYATTHVNMAMYTEDFDACPRCGESKALVRNGKRQVKTNSTSYQEWHCAPKNGGCGHYPRTRLSDKMSKTKFI